MDPFLALAGFNTLAGLGSDIYGGISARNQQRRLDDIRRQQQDQIRQQQDYIRRVSSPEAIAQGTERLYQPLQGQALQEVNRMLQAGNAMQGVQDGGYGQLVTARALAEQDFARRQQAQNAYLQSIGQGGQMYGQIGQTLSQMPRTVGERFGTSGATGQGLSQLAMLHALRGGGQNKPSYGASTMGTGGDESGWMNMRGYGDYGNSLQPGLQPYQPMAFQQPYDPMYGYQSGATLMEPSLYGAQ